MGAQLAGFAVLLVAVRAVGLDEAALDWVVVFAAYSAVAIVTTIPIFNTPGLAELIYIGALNLASGGEAADELAAAVFVFRILTWLAPIPIGAIAYSSWRKDSQVKEGVDPLDNFATTE